MEKKIDSSRLRELENAEKKLQALQNGGVDNWEGYDYAMEGFRKEQEFNEKVEEAMDDIETILSLGVDQPAGQGCGYGFYEKSSNEALERLFTLVKELKH